MTSETILRNTFRTVGQNYGYENVDAEFVAFKELKIKWQRSYGKAEFKVSDYLIDAPKEILTNVAETLFSKICGKDADYPETMSKWMTTDEFVENKRPVYIKRSRNLTRSATGDHKNLCDSLRRLIESGLISKEQTEDVYFSWTREPNIRRVGYCSVLMKVIAISSIFDTEDIPDFVLDYVVYHEMIHINAGFNPFGRKHGPEFTREERKHPQYEEAEEFLKRLSLYV